MCSFVCFVDCIFTECKQTNQLQHKMVYKSKAKNKIQHTYTIKKELVEHSIWAAVEKQKQSKLKHIQHETKTTNWKHSNKLKNKQTQNQIKYKEKQLQLLTNTW